MRKRWIWTLTAVCAVILLSAGAFYMLEHSKHQRVKQRYDVYMAQYDKLVSDAGYLPRVDEDTEYSNALDNLLDQAEESKNYLKKHAPHLLTQEKPDSRISTIRDNFKVAVEGVRKVDPDLAAKLEAEFAQIQQEYDKVTSNTDTKVNSYFADIQKNDPETAAKIESELEAELASFQQELLDHEADMVAFEKRREERRQSRLEFEKKSAENSARLNKLIDNLRSHLILDENGKLIGIKESSIFNTARSESGSPIDPADSTLPIDVLPEKEDIENGSEESREISPTIPDDPRFSQQGLVSEMARLNSGFYEKYPDVAIQSLLSETEFARLFPTQADRRELAHRTKVLQSTYAKEIDAFLQRIPSETRHTLLQQVQDDLTQKWDRDFAESVIKQLTFDDK